MRCTLLILSAALLVVVGCSQTDSKEVADSSSGAGDPVALGKCCEAALSLKAEMPACCADSLGGGEVADCCASMKDETLEPSECCAKGQEVLAKMSPCCRVGLENPETAKGCCKALPEAWAAQ